MAAALALACALGVPVVARRLLPAPPYQLLGNRQEFARDACAEFNPVGQDRHRTVFVDPGHGGPDPGASGIASDGRVLQEKTLTLAVAREMIPLLRARGYHVALSRLEDGPVARLAAGSLAAGIYTNRGEHADIEARVDCANASQAQLLISIHFNSYSDPGVGGVETTYDPSRPFSSRSRRFADLVQTSVLAALAGSGWTVPDRGVEPDTALGTPAATPEAAAYGHLLELGPAAPGWLDHPSQMPGALCEPLFLTDPREASIVEHRVGQEVLAHALTRAIDEYFQRR